MNTTTSPVAYWNEQKAFVAYDRSINLTSNLFYERILPKLKIPAKQNRIFDALKNESYIITNPKENLRSLMICNEDKIKYKDRFISISRRLLNDNAKRKVDEAVVSALFHKRNNHIENFIPYIRHEDLDLVAGSVVTDYKLGNPFIAVTGSPGSGKSDWMMMQSIQRAAIGDVVVVLDPTNSFSKEELSGHNVPDDIIEKYFTFWNMSTQGWPVNILDCSDCENNEQQIQKISSLFVSGMHLTGVNQKSILESRLSLWLTEQKGDFKERLSTLIDYFEDNVGQPNLQIRLQALLSTVKMTNDEPMKWEEILSSRGRVLVISSGNATTNVDSNPLDVILDSLYSYKDKHRDKSVTIVLDEFQTFNRHNGCTLEAILSRGRKLNFSVILASQDFSNEKDNMGRFYNYCGTKVFFRPLGEKCAELVAKVTHVSNDIISSLPDCKCVIIGTFYSNFYEENIIVKEGICGYTFRPSLVEKNNNKYFDWGID